MKVLVLKNNISKSLKPILKEIADYYSDIEPLEFTEKKISKTIQYERQIYYTQNGGQDFQFVSEKWLKEISPNGYDIVIFIADKLKGNSIGDIKVNGLSYLMSSNPKLIALKYSTSNTFTFCEGSCVKYNGDLKWTIIHELSHSLCNLKGLPDLTHKYFLSGQPKDCFKEMKPIVILKRETDDGIQTLGTLTFNDFSCKTLERPWKDNQKNISCIPKGIYNCKWTFSPKFLKYTYEVQDVKNRSGIRVHSGNYWFDIEGCVLLGSDYMDINKDGEKDIINSRTTIYKFNELLNKKDFTLVIR